MLARFHLSCALAPPSLLLSSLHTLAHTHWHAHAHTDPGCCVGTAPQTLTTRKHTRPHKHKPPTRAQPLHTLSEAGGNFSLLPTGVAGAIAVFLGFQLIQQVRSNACVLMLCVTLTEPGCQLPECACASVWGMHAQMLAWSLTACTATTTAVCHQQQDTHHLLVCCPHTERRRGQGRGCGAQPGREGQGVTGGTAAVRAEPAEQVRCCVCVCAVCVSVDRYQRTFIHACSSIPFLAQGQ